MRMLRTLLVATAVLALAVPALAGEGHGECTATTQECLNKMTSYYTSAGWSGLDGDFDKETGVFTVTSVASHSPAAEAGLRVDDLIVGMNGEYFADMSEEDWAASKSERTPGKEVTYITKRDGHKKKVAVTLAKMPENLLAEKIGKHIVDHATVASVQ